MEKDFIYKFTKNEKIIDEIFNKYTITEILKNPYNLIEFINIDEIEKVIFQDEYFKDKCFKSSKIRAYLFEYVNFIFERGHTAISNDETINYIANKTKPEIEEKEIKEEINNLIVDSNYLIKINYVTTR